MKKDMIPKIIHYCWFGRTPLPDDVKEYIATWKKYCPDYQIMEWNEDNFDINSCDYVKEAYGAKKWAFVSDYVRLYTLYTMGGVYMDTDVEVVKSFDELLKYNAFSGYESSLHIPTGTMGACKNNEWIKLLLDDYRDRHFVMSDGEYDLTTNVVTITRLTVEKYNIELNGKETTFGKNMVLLPFDYLCAKSFDTGQIIKSANTYTIHHFKGSWLSDDEHRRVNLTRKLSRYFGNGLALKISGFWYYAKTGGVQGLWKKLKKLVN